MIINYAHVQESSMVASSDTVVKHRYLLKNYGGNRMGKYHQKAQRPGMFRQVRTLKDYTT